MKTRLSKLHGTTRSVRSRGSDILPGGVVVNVLLVVLILAIALVAVQIFNRPAPQPTEIVQEQKPAEPKPVVVPKPVEKSAEPQTPAPETALSEDSVPLPRPAPTPEEKTTEPDEPNAAVRLAAESDLLLKGVDSTRQAALDRDRALLDLAMTGAAWDAYRALLARSIHAATAGIASGEDNDRCKPIWDTPALYKALLRWNILNRFPQSAIVANFMDSYNVPMWLWLLDNNEAMEEMLLTIKPEDEAEAVLALLKEAWKNDEKLFQKYYSLALACAVVFDHPLMISHPVGTQSQSGTKVDGLERYLWYVEKNEKGKLAAPVHHSNANDLVWAVCAPVSTTELDWAIKKLNGSRENWGNNYGRIEYLMERAVEGYNPYAEYTFEEILKHGGICGDQTYFCVNTARAHGIPAMGISGETNSGGHAWAGIKTSAREWNTSIGRIAGASKGTAANPQTGGRITEQEILHWNDRHHQSDIYTLAVYRHLWFANLLQSREPLDDHAAIVRLANRLGSSFIATWSALYSVLERETKYSGEPAVPENLEEWKTYVADMRREFKENPRMTALAATAEEKYIFPHSSQGDVNRTLLRERRRMTRESGEQVDLIAESLKRQADLIASRGDPEAKREICRLYDRALRDFGGSVTGFKMMANDYFGHVRSDPELARKAARDIELAFNRVIETGTKEWFRANTEASIYRAICGYYREAGDVKRAETLEKRMETLLRRSRRSAL